MPTVPTSSLRCDWPRLLVPSKIDDVSFDTVAQAILAGSYDGVILASGYEPRATHFASRAEITPASSNVKVLGFTSGRNHRIRVRNDSWFTSHTGSPPVLADGDDEAAAYDVLRSLELTGEYAHLCVDYSSMPRVWYSAVMNWIRLHPTLNGATIDFVYSPGAHPKRWPRMKPLDLVGIPSCQGNSGPLADTVLLVGLGYDAIGPTTVYELLEPRVVYALYATPGAETASTKRALDYNRRFLDRCADYKLGLPIDSISDAVRVLSETVAGHVSSSRIALVGLGPKSHVLATILVAMRHPEASCLRIKHERAPALVRAAGPVVACRVEFELETRCDPAPELD